MLLRLAIALGVLAVAGMAWAADGTSPSGLTLRVAVALGALQGATEFLPVSSSGHLALGQAFFDITPEGGGHRFSIVAHLGTLIAVMWMYRDDIVELIKVLGRPRTPSRYRRTLLMIGIGTAPLLLVFVPGVQRLILTVERDPRLVGGCLLFTALILFVAFRRPSELGEDETRPPDHLPALLIGLAQLLAVLPGISRSGSTIAVALALGMGRAAAARFSFLISTAAILGATVLELSALGPEAHDLDPLPYVAGFVVSFGVGLGCLRLLLKLVRDGRIGGFVVYLLIVGTAAIVWGAR